MAYTPDLTISASATLRRIAWAVGKPMTRTLNEIFTKLPALMDKDKVCKCCKDPSACSICGFGSVTQKGGEHHRSKISHNGNHHEHSGPF